MILQNYFKETTIQLALKFMHFWYGPNLYVIKSLHSWKKDFYFYDPDQKNFANIRQTLRDMRGDIQINIVIYSKGTKHTFYGSSPLGTR